MGPLAGLGSFNRLAGRRGRSGSSPRLPVTLSASRYRAGCSSRALDNRWDCVNLDVVLYFIFYFFPPYSFPPQYPKPSSPLFLATLSLRPFL